MGSKLAYKIGNPIGMSDKLSDYALCLGVHNMDAQVIGHDSKQVAVVIEAKPVDRRTQWYRTKQFARGKLPNLVYVSIPDKGLVC